MSPACNPRRIEAKGWAIIRVDDGFVIEQPSPTRASFLLCDRPDEDELLLGSEANDIFSYSISASLLPITDTAPPAAALGHRWPHPAPHYLP